MKSSRRWVWAAWAPAAMRSRGHESPRRRISVGSRRGWGPAGSERNDDPEPMALVGGARLGPYEIVAPLGVGGMGEVYPATDTNLKRAVAIKVLPDQVAGDIDRLARFQREAEVLASLNHPNIAGIYGLERSQVATALVMELVEGPTLADRIQEGALAVD